MCYQILITALMLVSPLATSNAEYRTIVCEDGSIINMTSLCDGKVDCLDGSDEKYVGRGFKCNVNKNKRACILPQHLLYDGFADCSDSSDICFDEKSKLLTRNCFQCLNGEQVIALTQVCDGSLDCDDFSDECLCMNNGNPRPNFSPNPICKQVCHVTKASLNDKGEVACGPCSVGEVMCSDASMNETLNVISTESHQADVLCLSQSDVCNGVVNCPNGEDENFCQNSFHCQDNNDEVTSCDGKVSCSDFSDECATDCWINPHYCKSVNEDAFYCNETERTNVTSAFPYIMTSSQVCDNVINCASSKNDESSCLTSSHFYCWSGNTLFVNQSRRFDKVIDCMDGSDECSGIFNVSESDPFSHQDFIIRNPFLQVLVWVMAFFALTGNMIVIFYTSKELWKDREVQRLGRLAKCNRTFVLNLAFADLLMGIYLLMLGIQGAMKANNYCSEERAWRTSRMCILMGILMQVSSQTSVFILLLMTSYRLYGTLHPFRVEESKLTGGAAAATFVFWVLSITIALIPQSRFASDYFVTQYWYPLPFLNHDLLNRKDMETLVLNIHTFTINRLETTLEDLRWKSMISYMWNSNVTVLHPQWQKQRLVPIGFYNQYSTCQPFFYPNVGDTAWIYMTSIVFFNFLAFAYIAIAYGVIYKASSRPCVRKSVRRRSKQWRRDNRKMQKKIFCLVLTDLLCWMPICIIMLLKLSGVKLHPVVHAVTGTVLLPINSAVNPILYSSMMTNFKQLFRKKQYPGYFAQSSSNDANCTAPSGSLGSLLNVKFSANDSSSHHNGQHHDHMLSTNTKKKMHVRFSRTSSTDSGFHVKNATTELKSLHPSKQHCHTLVRARKMTAAALFEIDMKESII